MLIPTICFNCEVGCGLLAYVDKDTQQIRKFEGNPAYPGSRGRNCARGPATINQVHDPERKIPYEDPELGFCILAHAYSGAKDSPPHDHGPTWAIYGQGIGETEMTDWELVTPATQDTPGKVRKAKVYTLKPGMAYVYNEGDLHSPRREGATRLIRIEGKNIETVRRFRYEPV